MNRLSIFNLSIFLISFLGCNNDVLGQTYPVQVQPSVTFASTFLSDYNDPSNVNIRVYLSDVTKTNYQIRLKVKLTSDKFSAVSKTGILLTLQGGQVYFLNDVELGDLFNVNNLLISSNVQTNTDNSMPEGVYTMSFEAYDATLPGDIVVSNAATDFTVFSVNRYDPPLLTTPANKQEFDVATVNQNIFFNWTPRQMVFSPKQQVKYRFRMIKVQPVDRNPYDAINTTLPATIDVKDLDFPVFIYSPADLQLEEGCVYAWQVTAYEEVTVGGVLQESSARFKNLGMSEVFTLSIKENCQPVTPFVAPKVDQNLVALQWNFDPSHKEYELAYRPLGGSLPWTPVSTVNNLYNLDNTVLQRGVQYEYTVRAKCKNWLDPSYGGTFTLPDASCNAPEPVMVDNTSDDTKLSWTAVNGVSAYRFQYRNLSDATYTTVNLDNTTTTYSLPKLTSGGYKIKVDGVCGTDIAEGTPNDIAFDETGLVGPCPIPVPFQLIATRTQGTQAQLSWPLSTAHTGYSITYWHRDSVDVKRTLTSTDPKVLADFVYDDQLYNYQITFICDTKNTTTPVGMFRVEGSAGGVLKDPTTGNCFPPAVVQGEPRSTSSALFEWSKVDGVDGYQLMYSVKGENKFVPFNTISTSEVIKNLKDSEKYQFVVLSRCGSKYSIPSDTGMVDLAGGKSNADCDSASYFISTGQTTTNIRLCWPYVAGNTGYKLTYREEAQSPADEYTEAFTDIDAFKHDHLSQTGDTLKYTLDNLKAGTPYIFKLQVLCSSGDALRNAPLKVSTMPDTKSSGECGKDQSCDKTNVTPLPSLAPGDSIHCADYGILIDKVTASDPATGTYSGSGFMNMPMPGLSDFVRMSVSFVNVKINAQPNSCIYDGSINIDSINASVLPIELRDKVKQIEGQIDDAITNAQNALDQAQQGIDAAQDAVQTAIDYFQGGDSVGNVQDGGLGEATTTQTITLPATATVNGTTATIGGTTLNSLPGLIKDGTGNVFQVGPDGTVKHVGEYDPTLAGDPTLDLDDGRVVYSENPTAKYDFDEWKSMYAGITQIEREYEKIGDDYYVPAKLILPGYIDPVYATLQGDYDKSKIKFANGKGMVYDQNLSVSTFTINIAGGPAADGQYIYAWFVDGSTKKAIGKLLVPSYAPQEKNVVIIPVGKSDVDAAKYQKGLNDVYSKIGITYTVTVDESFRNNTAWDTDGDGKVQASGSKLLSTDYKGEEANMIQEYVDTKGGEDELDPNTAYFLAVYEASNLEDNLLGKMPAQQQFGFLYVGGAQEPALVRTIAHEIGHGAYHLEHTFHNLYLGANSKTKTNNIMDYSNGLELWKYQWDIIYDPGHVWGILKQDGDAQAVDVTPAVDPNFTIEVCSTTVDADNKIIIKAENCKVYTTYSGIAQADLATTKIKVKFSIKASENKTVTTQEFTIDGNVKTENVLTTFPDGKWTVTCYKNNNLVSTRSFYVRDKKYDYACSKCGRDLSYTEEKLKAMFSSSSFIKKNAATIVTYFNNGNQKMGLTTCLMHAQLYAQCQHESGNFSSKLESYNYYLLRMLAVFNNNEGAKDWFTQSFWDDKTYLDYVNTNVYEKTDNNDGGYDFDDKEENYATVKWKNSSTQKVKVPYHYLSDGLGFSKKTDTYKENKDKNGNFKLNIVSNADKLTHGKKLLNEAYYGMLGNTASSTSDDGFNYRGRGLIQLTGKTNYQNAQDACNKMLKPTINYDWVGHPEYVERNEDAVYSALGWLYNSFPNMNDLHTLDVKAITLKVNAKGLGYVERKAFFDKLHDNFFYDCIEK